jgi:hypothetical protein
MITERADILFGNDRQKSLRSILFAIGVSIVVFSANTTLAWLDFSVSPHSYIFLTAVVLFVATSTFRNNGFVVSLLIAWILAVAAVASGSFAGFHGEPTFVERYVTGPAVLGLGLGIPMGIFGYVVGIAIATVKNSSSVAQ